MRLRPHAVVRLVLLVTAVAQVSAASARLPRRRQQEDRRPRRTPRRSSTSVTSLLMPVSTPPPRSTGSRRPTSRPSTPASAPAPTRRWRRCRLDDHHRARQGAASSESSWTTLTARQLEKLLLGAAENPGTIPEVVAKRVEAEARQSSILDGYTFCLQPKPGGAARSRLRAHRHRQRDRRHPAEVARPGRAPARLDRVEGDRPAAQAGPDRAASSCATRWRARWATRRTSRSRSPTTA